jgi:hypothetical protein
MYPEITIKISMQPEAVKIVEGSKEVAVEDFAVPPMPVEAESEVEAFMEEDFSVPPVPEEDFDVVDEDLDIPPLPED